MFCGLVILYPDHCSHVTFDRSTVTWACAGWLAAAARIKKSSDADFDIWLVPLLRAKTAPGDQLSCIATRPTRTASAPVDRLRLREEAGQDVLHQLVILLLQARV